MIVMVAAGVEVIAMMRMTLIFCHTFIWWPKKASVAEEHLIPAAQHSGPQSEAQSGVQSEAQSEAQSEHMAHSTA